MEFGIEYLVPAEFIINASADISGLPPAVQEEIEEIRYEYHHANHGSMHLLLFLSVPIGLIIGQICLLIWKRRNYQSYHRCSLIGLWLIPVLFCVYAQIYQFVLAWSVFTFMMVNVIRLALVRPIKPSTPRWVYKYFYCTHMLSYLACMIGTLLFLGSFFAPLFYTDMTAENFDSIIFLAFTFILYGFYFGTLGRDTAEVVTDKMACTIGYYTTAGMPYRRLEHNLCAVCAQEILRSINENAVIEERFTLPCGHSFHEFCIRGWCIVGKKQTCPYCKEKVDLKRIFKNPWEKPHILYGDFLDFVRYFVVWQPLIIIAVVSVDNLLGLK